MKQLSIIVPAYNVSNFIEDCLNSIVADTSILDMIEILVINDGSTDDTLEKIILFADKYRDSIKLIDKENGGHGSGINIGVREATGKYLKVLDSDDWLVNSNLKKLVQYICSLSVFPDIIINAYEQVWGEDEKMTPYKLNKLETKKRYGLKILNDYNYRFTIHSLTIKTDIYQKLVKTKIDEKTSYDDVQYVLYPIPYINNLVYLDEVLYKYRMGNIGQSVSFVNMQKNRNKLKNILINTWSYYSEHKKQMSEEQNIYFLRDLGYTIGDYLNLLFTLSDEKQAKSEFFEFMKCVPISSGYIASNKARFTILTNGIFFKQVNHWYRKKRKIG